MGDGGTQYDLKLGLDTGPAKPGVEALASGLLKTGDAADKTQAKLDRVTAASGGLGVASQRTSGGIAASAGAADRLTASVARAEGSIAKTTASTDNLTTSVARNELAAAKSGLTFESMAKSVLLAGAAFLTFDAAKRALESLYDTAKQVDSQLASIRKTSNLLEPDILRLYKEIEVLGATEVAAPVADLESLASAAGDLGVTGVENIERYVKVIGALGVVSNLSGRDAAETLTKILNVTGEGPQNIERLGNVLVGLGRQSAATESQIAQSTLVVAQSTSEFKLGSTQAVAYGTALAELGERARTGGTVLGQTMKAMQDAVFNSTAASGMALQNFARISGVSAAQFRAEFAKSPPDALALFLKGLTAYGDKATLALEKVGLGGGAAIKVLGPLSDHYGRLQQLQALAAREAENNNALWLKLSSATGSLTGDLTKLENAWEIQKNEMSGGMTPALRSIVQELTAVLTGSDATSQEIGENLGKALGLAGDAAIVLIRNFELLKATFLSLLAIRVSVFFAESTASLVNWLRGATGVTAALAASRAAALAEAAAVTASAEAEAVAAAAKIESLAATVAAGKALQAETVVVGEGTTVIDFYAGSLEAAAVATVRTGTVTDLYDEKLVALDASVAAASAAELELAVANNTAAGAEARAAEAAHAEAIAMDRAMSSGKGFLSLAITPLAAGLTALLGVLLLVNSAVEDMAAKDQEAIEKMVAENNRLVGSIRKARQDIAALLDPNALQAQVETDVLAAGAKPGSEEAMRIAAQDAANLQRQRVAALREQEEELRKAKAAAADYGAQLKAAEDGYAKAKAAQAPSPTKRVTGFYPAPGAEAGDASSLDALARGVDELRAKAGGANAQAASLTQNVQKLTVATQGYVAVAPKLKNPNDLLTQQGQAWEKLRHSLQATIADQAELGHAYSLSGAAQEQALEKLEVDEKLRSADKDMILQHGAALEEYYRQIVHGEHEAHGDQVQRDLGIATAAQDRLNASYAGGAAAVDTMRAQLELEAQVREKLKGVTVEQRQAVEEKTRAEVEAARVGALNDRTLQVKTEARAEADLVDSYARGAQAIASTAVQEERAAQARQLLAGLTEKERAALAPLVKQLLDYRDALQVVQKIEDSRQTYEDLSAIAKLRRDDFATQRQFNEAVADLNAELELQKTIRDAIAHGANPWQVAQLESFGREEQKLRHQIERNATDTKAQWVDAAKSFGEALTAAGSKIGEVISKVADLVTAWQKVAEATTAAGRAAAGAGVGGQVAGLVGGLLGYQGNRGQSSFGGQLSGDYSQAGGSIGGAIGGVIGGILTSESGGWGAPIGAIIGGILGTVIGGAIKKGADEGSAHLSVVAGQVRTQVTTSEGGLGKVVSDWGEAVKRGLQSILGQLGGVLNGLPLVDIKVRDEVVRVIVGNVSASFKSIDEAVHFAIAESLKQGDISGLSDEVRQVLRKTTAATLDELASDLDFGRWVQRLGLPDVAVALQDVTSQLAQAIQRADQLGLSTDRISQWYARQLSLMRDQVLGIQQSPEEQLRANVAAFNQQVALTRAQTELQLADEKIKKADLEAKIVLAKAEADLERSRIVVRAGFLDADVQITTAAAGVLAGLTSALAAVDEAIKISETILAGLPDLINDKELQDALKRLHATAGKGGGAAGSNRDSFLKGLTDDVRALLPDAVRAVLDLGDKLADLAKQARTLRISESQLAAGRQALIDQAKRQILQPIQENLDPAAGGSFGLDAYQKAVRGVEDTFSAIAEANKKLLEETGQQAISDADLQLAKLRALGQAAAQLLDGLSLPIRGAREEVKKVGDALADIGAAVKSGALDAGEALDAIRELQSQAGIEVANLLASLLEQEGKFGEADKAKRAAEELNFYIQLAQLDILYTQYRALGLISDTLAKKLDPLMAIVNDPANVPNFDLPAPQRPSGAAASSDPFAEAQKLVDTIAVQVKEWNALRLGPMTKEATNLRDKMADLTSKAQQLAATVGGAGGLTAALTDLQSAYEVAVDDFVKRSLDQFRTVPEAVSKAEALRDKLADLAEAFRTLGLGADGAAKAEAARTEAVGQFVSDSLKDYARLGQNPLVGQLADLVQHFADLRTAFQTVGASADQMAELERARVAALNDFWQQAISGIRSLIDDLRAHDPRISSQQAFLAARDGFRQLAAAARGGDLDALSKLQDAATKYRDAGTAFLGSGVGSQAVLDELLTSLQGVASLDPVAADGPIASRLDDANDLLAQIRDSVAAAADAAQQQPSPAAAADSSGSSPASASPSSAAAASSPSPAAATPPPSPGGGDGYGTEVLAIMRRMDARAQRRDQGESQRESARRSRAARDDQARDQLLEVLGDLAGTLEALRSQLRRQQPPAGA